MKRRGTTRECITPRGKNKWLVRVFVGRDANGKVIAPSHTVHGTRKDAVRYRDQMRRDISVGTFVEPSRQSLQEFLEKWLKTSVQATVRAKTFEDYSRNVQRYLIPSLGSRRLSQLQPAEIQKLYNALGDTLSPRTVRYVHSTLHAALEQAVAWGELARNPARLVNLPKQRNREMLVLTGPQLKLLLEEARGTRFYALWVLLAMTGMRAGEALALKWQDLDGSRLRIQRTLARSKAGWSFEEPKTSRSRRVVVLPETAVSALKDLRRAQLEQRISAGPIYQDLDLVFATHSGQPLEWRVITRRHFRPLIKRLGLPEIRPYDLRHTHATLLLGSGENVKVVSERLGHASASMTLDVYSHVLPDMQQRAAEKTEELLFGSTQSARTA